MVIDPTTPLGQVRLKIGDTQDLPFLPDNVITTTLAAKNNNVSQASQECAQYILAMLSFKSHKKLAQLEIWGGDMFTQYVQFLKMTILNPAFSDVCPIPYSPPAIEGNPLSTSIGDWKAGYIPGTVVLPFPYADPTEGFNYGEVISNEPT